MSSALLSTRLGQYSILEIALPGQDAQPAGVLLFDPEVHRMGLRLRRDWRQIAEPEDAEVLALLEDDLADKVRELGPEQLYEYLEGSLSNALRISDRDSVLLSDFGSTLNRLYNRLVPATVQQFRTHLPVYSCRAAAGRFGEQMQVEEEGWIEAPADLRLTEDMFVARVVGRSMEPEIPDGSLCVFRANVAGSRQGKKLLVENFAEAAEGGERYTVKRYRSKKVAREDGTWMHDQIVMEPLNPEFEPWEIQPEDHDRVRVIAEFVRVLE
jgi:phage repressor protein C with HTH and peptisase S24 domain